jgi:hypothetical protein
MSKNIDYKREIEDVKTAEGLLTRLKGQTEFERYKTKTLRLAGQTLGYTEKDTGFEIGDEIRPTYLGMLEQEIRKIAKDESWGKFLKLRVKPYIRNNG